MTQNKINLEEIRISFLFNIKNPVDDHALELSLIDKKYKINKDRVITRPPLQAVILNFARKGGVDIIYEKNQLPTFLGVVGKNKELVIQEFENLKFILEDIDNLLVEQAASIETVITFNVFDKYAKPDTSLAHFASPQIKILSEKFTADYVMDNFTLRSKDGHEPMTIHVAPLYRDKRFFYMQLFLRSKRLESVFKFAEEQETYINNILGFLSKNE